MAINVAAIGLGLLGKIECEAYDNVDGVEIIAGADVSAEAQDTFKTQFQVPTYETLDEILRNHEHELDAINIVTPHTLHYQQAKRCLKEGYHVFLEKPMTTDVSNAAELVKHADQNGTILQLGYQRHFEPVFREIRRVVESGQLGRIHMAACFLGQKWISTHEGSWRVDPSMSGGGQLYDSGSHLLDTLLWTLNAEPMTVMALVDNMGHDVDVNSALAATLNSSGDKITASIGITGNGRDTTPYEGFIIWGSEGFISFSDGKLSLQEKGGYTYETEIEFVGFHDITQKKIKKFVSAIKNNSSSPVPGVHGVEVTALTEAAYRSAKSESAVNVQSILDEAYQTAEDRIIENS